MISPEANVTMANYVSYMDGTLSKWNDQYQK